MITTKSFDIMSSAVVSPYTCNDIYIDGRGRITAASKVDAKVESTPKKPSLKERRRLYYAEKRNNRKRENEIKAKEEVVDKTKVDKTK